MKLLFVHADYLNYRVEERTKSAEEVPRGRESGSVRDPLIVFACAERVDEESEDVVERTLSEIKDILAKTKAKNVVIFPFAHLSNELAEPDFAIRALKSIERRLAEGGHEVLRVPFGWYKVFEFRSKGHPLAVLFRSLLATKSVK